MVLLMKSSIGEQPQKQRKSSPTAHTHMPTVSSEGSVVVVEEATGLASIRVDGCDEKVLGGPGGMANLGEHIGVGSLDRGVETEEEEDGENYSDYINPSSSKGECAAVCRMRRCGTCKNECMIWTLDPHGDQISSPGLLGPAQQKYFPCLK